MENIMSKLVPFHELAVGSTFKFQGIDYTKIETIRVSCCTALNAAQVNHPEVKQFITPVQQVEVND